MIKPGYKTSEFWFTLVSFLFSGAYLVGLLDSVDQKDDLISETSKGLEALILIIGQLAVLFRYIKGRNDIKQIWWNNQKTVEEKKDDIKPRVNKRRSRKTNSKLKKPTGRS
jgi:hypothetical protein